VAVQRVLAFQIERMLEAQKLSRTQMSRRMKTSRAALDRLLDPTGQALPFQTLERAAHALGKRLQIHIA
jgi:antitoxin HicB